MIIPSKHLPLDRSALGCAAIVLRDVSDGMTVSEAWGVAEAAGVRTFDQFVAGVDLLFLLGVVDHVSGKLVRQ